MVFWFKLVLFGGSEGSSFSLNQSLDYGHEEPPLDQPPLQGPPAAPLLLTFPLALGFVLS